VTQEVTAESANFYDLLVESAALLTRLDLYNSESALASSPVLL
jgi:hypothetical protein